uniref:Triacylglycerol lipase n=1 Tax=Opuntia streptacantha TaxID=393608 RepID=A0A7C9E8Y7_OPUST
MHCACFPSMASINVALCITALLLSLASPKAEGARAFYIFGDSLVDSGNNNYLATEARADLPPYGIDFPTHRPTGRFSNGLNIPDLIGERIGTGMILPYLSPQLTGQRLVEGANFASAGIGVLNDTGIQFASIIRIYRQLEFFQEYQRRLAAVVGTEQAQSRVNQAVVLITLGGNDFVNNYFLPGSIRRLQFTIPNYVRYVLSEYRKVLLRLHELGARRILVTGTGPIGCVPGELASQGSRNGECAAGPTQAANLYNPQLTQMLRELNSQVGSNAFIASNTGRMLNDFVNNPRAYGFTTSKLACCGQGPYNGLGLCTTASNLCPNRDVYVFWDAFHPTERANRFIVREMMLGSVDYMSPMNLSTIMALDGF